LRYNVSQTRKEHFHALGHPDPRPSGRSAGAVFGVLQVALGIEMIASGVDLWVSASR
jgi:hypothetical protein